jgi:spermidine/putrescine transport system substrate-binding protein
MTHSSLRRFVIGAGIVVVALGAAACGGSKARSVLHIYTWADYVKPELVARFEAENGCKVVVDTFDSNEAMYAKLKAGAAGYDLITPTSYMVSLMQSQGMLQPLNRDWIPNLVHVDSDYLASLSTRRWTIPSPT